MKKISPPLFVLLFISVVSLASCDTSKVNNKAAETATAFYTNLQQRNYEAALGQCSDKAYAGTSRAAWIKVMERNAGLLGNIVSFTKTSDLNIAVSTSSGTTTAVAYDVQWQYGQSKDSILLVKEKDGSMKIYRYSWQHSNAKYMTEMDESEKQANLYMNAIKQQDYTAALGFCADEAFAITPKEQWMVFFENADQKMGAVQSFTVVSDSTTYAIEGTGQAGKGNYYDVFINTNRGNGSSREKIVFFQKDYNVPVKLAGHFFL